MENIFLFLYPMAGVVAMIAYIPQIKSLITAKTNCREISMSCWFMWTMTASISLGYGITNLGDLLFCISCGLNVLCTASITCLVAYRKYFYKPDLCPLSQAAE